VSLTTDHLHFPASATVGEVLQAYRDQGADWWWLLTTRRDGQYYVCSFGSLLPYLTGRTPHIVHRIGHCPICSGLDPLLWQDTSALVEEALADSDICARTLADLPMAELPTVDAGDADGTGPLWGSVRAVLEHGVVTEIYVIQIKGDLGGMPGF